MVQLSQLVFSVTGAWVEGPAPSPVSWLENFKFIEPAETLGRHNATSVIRPTTRWLTRAVRTGAPAAHRARGARPLPSRVPRRSWTARPLRARASASRRLPRPLRAAPPPRSPARADPEAALETLADALYEDSGASTANGTNWTSACADRSPSDEARTRSIRVRRNGRRELRRATRRFSQALFRANVEGGRVRDETLDVGLIDPGGPGGFSDDAYALAKARYRPLRTSSRRRGSCARARAPAGPRLRLK